MSVSEAAVRTYPDISFSDIKYPESDGEPMGETGFHVRASMHLYSALRLFFIKNRDIYVAANMFLYYKEGNPRSCKSPDVMVIKGAGSYERRIFKVWEEGAVPCVIFEITSESTKHEDMINKKELYASLGVNEYFLFDPLGEYLKKPLGFRLSGKKYVPVLTDTDGQLFSRELGTFLSPQNDLLRIVNPRTGRLVPGLDEAVSEAEEERQRAEAERRNAESERQRAEAERRNAEVERRNAESERQRAETEHRRAEKLAAQLRALGIEPEKS